MNVTKQEGNIVYEDITRKFNQGDIYYLDTPYICEKSDLSRIETAYLAGRRKVLIISNDEFNKTSQYRWVIPISTYHGTTICTNSKKILFKSNGTDISVLNLDQLHTRHVSEFKEANKGHYIYSLSLDFLKIIIDKVNMYTAITNINSCKTDNTEKQEEINDIFDDEKIDDMTDKDDNIETENEYYERKINELSIPEKCMFNYWDLNTKIKFIKAVKNNETQYSGYMEKQ